MQNWKKFSTLFSLYIAQSVPMSFFSTVVPVIMRQENYSLESIAYLQLIKIPWILKFIWAPLIDNKTRSSWDLRRWIIVSEVFYAFVIVSIGFLRLDTDFTLIILLLVVAFITSATQDIATDAFAILHLKSSERGLGNSMQSAGSFLGSLLGTGVLLIAYYYLGWSLLLFLLASFVIFALLPLSFYRKKHSVIKEKIRNVNLKDIGSFFAQKGIALWILVLVFYYSGIIGNLAMLKPYMVDLHYNEKEIGLLSGIIGTAFAALSAFASGLFIKKAGRKIALISYSILNIVTGTYLFLFLPGAPTLYVMLTGICLLWGSYGFSTVIIYTMSMDNVRKNREGTDFTLQIVLTHFSSILITIISGRIGDAFGFKGLFGAEIIFSLVAFLIVILFIVKQPGKFNVIKEND